MKKKKKILISIISMLLVAILVVCGFNIYFVQIGKIKQIGAATGYNWAKTDDYSTQKDIKIPMGDGEYKILVLTDIHLKNHATFGAFIGVNYILDWAGEIAIRNLVKKTAPDLIIVLGDSVLTDRNDIETKRLANLLDSFGIKWAHVFGNHDDEGRADKAKLADVLLESKHGLFSYGPNDLHGAGNYIINLTRGEKTEYALFLLDSGSSLQKDTNGINEKQVDWYKWNMAAYLAKDNFYPKNMAFFHIPTKDYDQLANFELGERGEPTFSGDVDDGLVSAMRGLAGTHVMVGHDHDNNFIANVDGIKLGYTMKSSYNCYFTNSMTGGTLLTIDNTNTVKEELIYF